MKSFHHQAEPEKAPYHYTMCGLDDVYLASGYDRVETEYGPGVVIRHQDELHRAIGAHLACSKKTLSGKEVRFLRHEMDLTQEQLGGIMRVADQTVARWEKEETPISGPADLMIRALYLGHISKQVDVRVLADKLRTMDAPAIEMHLFVPTARGWKAQQQTAAACD